MNSFYHQHHRHQKECCSLFGRHCMAHAAAGRWAPVNLFVLLNDAVCALYFLETHFSRKPFPAFYKH